MNDCVTKKTALTTYEDAIANILAQAATCNSVERIDLYQALGRVLAEDVTSKVNVPPADNSSMDGYAVRSSDIKTGAKLAISQRIPAGYCGETLAENTVARIFTGASIPDGADAVVMQELVDNDNDEFATFQSEVKRGENIRRQGEDIKESACILSTGMKLRPQDIGLAASVGNATLQVFKKLKVAIFFTGDELVEPGNPLDQGQIYNSNQYSLYALLDALGCEIINLGIVEDTLEATRATLLKASELADLVVTSGGVSVGEEDYVRVAVEELGQLNMWKLKIKPGKPLVLGKVNNADFIGLPGNPVSAFATFCLFVRPFILKAQGLNKHLPDTLEATADFDWPRPGIRREFLRARLCDGKVSIYPHQGSGVLSSASWANGLAIVKEGNTVEKGDAVTFMPFHELLA